MFLITVSFLLNLLLSIVFFGTQDVTAWIRSAGITNGIGVIDGYQVFSLVYPPFATVLLWITGLFHNIGLYPGWLEEYPTAQQIGNSYIPIKIAVLFFLYLTGAVVYFFAVRAKKVGIKRARQLVLKIFLNPVFILSTPILGYIDIFFSPFLLLSLFFNQISIPYFAGVFLAISFSIKLLPLLILPVFFASFIHLDIRRLQIKIYTRQATLFFAGLLTVILPVLIIFGYDAIEKIFRASVSLHGIYLSNGAANFNYLLGYIIHSNDTPAYWLTWSRLIFYAIGALSVIKVATSRNLKENFYKASIAVLFGYFIFVTGAHENHLFPALVVAAGLLTSKFSKENLKLFNTLSVIIFLNLFIFYGFGQILIGGKFISLIPGGYSETRNILTLVLSVFNTLYFIKYFCTQFLFAHPRTNDFLAVL